jgi:hypothetical protein
MRIAGFPMAFNTQVDAITITLFLHLNRSDWRSLSSEQSFKTKHC